MNIFYKLILNFVINKLFFRKTLNMYNKYLILLILRGNVMNIINDETGQGAAEYILLFGGVIVIAIAVLMLYNNWIKANNLNSTADIHQIRTSV